MLGLMLIIITQKNTLHIYQIKNQKMYNYTNLERTLKDIIMEYIQDTREIYFSYLHIIIAG